MAGFQAAFAAERTTLKEELAALHRQLQQLRDELWDIKKKPPVPAAAPLVSRPAGVDAATQTTAAPPPAAMQEVAPMETDDVTPQSSHSTKAAASKGAVATTDSSHMKRRVIVAQVVAGQESRADWVLRQAAAELSALQRAVPSLLEGDTVAVCCRKSVLFLPAMVATLCSGAVCAVVNADLPLESLRRALQELKPAAVMCERPTAETASDARPPGCPLQLLGAAEAVPDALQVLLTSAQALQGDNLRPAIALLTSGTTGQPKVIRIPRRSIALMVHEKSVKLMVYTFYTILFKTVMLSGNEDSGAHGLCFQPTVIFMPPNQWISLARHCPEGRLRSAVQQVRLCVTGGSALSAERHAWLEARTGRPLSQWYGQTETFVLSNMLVSRCGRPPPGSVGRPHAGLQAKVLDLETGKCLGPGVDGELCFKGWSIIKDFADEEGWIHTGDVGHCDADGNFYIVDRIKELIKYRGAHKTLRFGDA
ncbi:uncharacterized protein LOC126413117 [Schistocerca serialis cubense]|uniref:uncharacterized protein LOC126413117 n=1 Tax=Schistocerca serialis cubense TaxID=2023355 RepID=UPI00214F34AC|nr:uncharacterized protein LOC126413117 [Schistocerca serialis cubense]